MMGRRQKLKGGLEWDVVCKAPLCLFDKPGIKKSLKAAMNRRDRRLSKKKVNQFMEEK